MPVKPELLWTLQWLTEIKAMLETVEKSRSFTISTEFRGWFSQNRKTICLLLHWTDTLEQPEQGQKLFLRSEIQTRA